MNFLTSTATEKFADHFCSKLNDCINNFKGQQDDKALVDAIRQEVTNQYGNEPFYNKLDQYLTCNQIVDSLVLALRKSSQQSVVGMSEFVGNHVKRFLDENQSYLGYSSQIKDAFSLMFNCAYIAITNINSYSDIGRLQSEMRIQEAETRAQMQAGFAMLRDIMGNCSQFLQNEMASENLPDFSTDAEDFKVKLKEIETTYQHQSRYNEALAEYGNLALLIAEAEMRRDAKSTLLCALRCNMALCHSNLGNVEEAMKSLDRVSTDIAQHNETYNCVWASIVVQHRLEDKYSEALNRTEIALKIKPDYCQAFFLRQHLLALMELKDQHGLIEELDSYFSEISDEEKKKELLGDYYAFRGLICTTFNDSTSAYENYEKAALYGHNEFVSRFNMLSSLYGQAVKNVPYGKRAFPSNVDIPKLYKVMEGLKALLKDKRMGEKVYQDARQYAVSLYVSASVITKGTHDLQPLEEYLTFSKDYDTTKMLILGSTENLAPDIIQLLKKDDQFLLEIRQLLRNNDLPKCREKIEQRLNDPDYEDSADTILTLLKVCIASEDLKTYRRYRNSVGIEEVAGDFLTAMDACAYEIEGDIEKAKIIFDKLILSCMDYDILENALRFYKRSNFYQECETLYFKIHSLQKERKIYIDDLDSFYCTGLDYMISKKQNVARDFFEAAPKDAISPEAYLYMEKRLYQATNDPVNLCFALSQEAHDDFQNKVNQAICQRLMCHYDDSLNLCLDLIQHAKGIGNEQLVKAYWLISDLYLFKKMPEESYSWALKAHILMEKLPYDQTHSAFLGRIMRSGHFEGLSDILEYQKIHPNVINFFRTFHVSPDDDMPQKLLQQIQEYCPDTKDYVARERQIASDYKNLPLTIHMLSQYFNGDWGHVLSFAKKSKLHLGTGDPQRQQLEASWLDGDILVDAQTLIIMSACDCLSLLQMFDHIHISYSSISILQHCYLANNFALLFIEVLMDWINSEEKIVLEPDGMIDVNDAFIRGFSEDFFIGCNIAERISVPFLCADIVAIFLQQSMDSPISKDIHFITLPVLCKVLEKDKPDLSAQMIYNLIQYGSFISFSAGTVFENIKSHNFQVSEELLQPFLICKSDYDMQSFSGVYLGAIFMLKNENEIAAIDLSEIILLNTMKVWRHGLYYREALKRVPANSEMRYRNVSILKYAGSIIEGIKKIWNPLPRKIGDLCNKLQETITNEMA